MMLTIEHSTRGGGGCPILQSTPLLAEDGLGMIVMLLIQLPRYHAPGIAPSVQRALGQARRQLP